MKSIICLIVFAFTSVMTIAATTPAYTESLYLCDLGIKNANTTNQLGVDFIEYTQVGRNEEVGSGINFVTASNLISAIDPLFNLWSSNYGITNVSIDLESDNFGSQYYLQYCYNWIRNTAKSNNNGSYKVNFTTTLPTTITNTQASGVTDCSIISTKGVVTQVTTKGLTALSSLSGNSASMRCTIKINYIEDILAGARPHNGDAIDINPVVKVSVQ